MSEKRYTIAYLTSDATGYIGSEIIRGIRQGCHRNNANFLCLFGDTLDHPRGLEAPQNTIFKLISRQSVMGKYIVFPIMTLIMSGVVLEEN